MIPFFLVWGSFLNMSAYRLLSGDSFLRSRSFCPHCKKNILWYDLIPLFSWICLRRSCRFCKAPISWLYFFIEILTVFALSCLVVQTSFNYFFAYFLFFSALIITIRTDLEHMLISRFVTLFLIPAAFFLCYWELLPLTLIESIIGASSAYCFLYAIRAAYYYATKKVGLGQGDLELLAFIGAFLGISGWWVTLMIGSFLGSVVGIAGLLFYKKSRLTKIPFGPFLAGGAMLYVLFGPWLDQSIWS